MTSDTERFVGRSITADYQRRRGELKQTDGEVVRGPGPCLTNTPVGAPLKPAYPMSLAPAPLHVERNPLGFIPLEPETGNVLNGGFAERDTAGSLSHRYRIEDPLADARRAKKLSQRKLISSSDVQRNKLL